MYKPYWMDQAVAWMESKNTSLEGGVGLGGAVTGDKALLDMAETENEKKLMRILKEFGKPNILIDYLLIKSYRVKKNFFYFSYTNKNKIVKYQILMELFFSKYFV